MVACYQVVRGHVKNLRQMDARVGFRSIAYESGAWVSISRSASNQSWRS